MSFPIAEVMRIGAAGVSVAGPGGAIAGAMLTKAANHFDKEDDPETPSSMRNMKRKRRKGWVDHAVELEKEKLQALKKVGDGVTEALKRALNGRAAQDIRAIIAADIYETENRIPGDQETNLYAEAVSAAARREL